MSYHNWKKNIWQNKLYEFENTTDFHYCFSSTPFLKVPGLKLEVPARFFVFFLMLLVNFVRQLAFSFTKQTAK